MILDSGVQDRLEQNAGFVLTYSGLFDPPGMVSAWSHAPVLATWIIRSKKRHIEREKDLLPCLPPKGGPSDKHRWVGVESDVVTSRFMLERRYFMLEKLLVWLVFLLISSG